MNKNENLIQTEQLLFDLRLLIVVKSQVTSELVQIGLDEEIKRIKAILCDNIMEA